MKKNIWLSILFLIISRPLFAQIDIAAGMGISFVYAPSLNSYLEMRADDGINTFLSTAEFFGEVDYSISEKYQIGFEYVYTLFDFASSYAGNYSLSYNHHKPSVLGYYVISGNGYKFKLGFGTGMRIINLTEDISIKESYDVIGIGFLFKAQGHTKLGEKFYANIGTSLRTDFTGSPTNKFGSFHEDININSISISVNLGITYSF
ncbi:MAG: hypothetical protein KKF62_03210 [Bacteroidetes bacterium]|nr:hypothetical protein [Bacteroidota bacterium]MBU1117108.1 hypothetical protein [Bacteroidota bacterium]MBU1798639.1 hypothetical protein [Bacteroidota bacterium]